MAELPSGTVSLLFSDIEGSTVLLSRLGPAYADALDGQRQVLRTAWADHGGTELGTEGDSFMVVFTTAEDAVAAAAQAQRELAGFDWPGGEQVRVRMGIHTGTPAVHDGGYVGMDVHRAARIAGSAHGGQVVISSATAELVSSCPPERVSLRDLGSHHLKDITHPERLLQLVIGGVANDFPPLKTLGASSSLPRPATPLVGRRGKLAELTALLSSPDVRLVTLTGPGGTGKTRLAIAVAERLRDRFPDGVYFCPLAAVTTASVMWTSIAEVLDVPPEGRIQPGFFDHVAHRSALFVLDNLEQVAAADDVVSQLLIEAPQVVVITTSRRALAVPGEHVHPVLPLELPDTDHLDSAGSSGAVQLFVQHATMVRPSFALTDSNAAEVAAICRRLDGLPLAIELAAARSRLLSPSALLARLDAALDIAATSKQGPSRQKTLRDTIAWSYDLLTAQQQSFYCRLGVFAGGADLDAVTAVTTDILDDADPLDLVGGLVDASLATISEGLEGEPRVILLETIRAYAVDQLTRTGDLDRVCECHAQHYLELAQRLGPELADHRYLSARARLEAESDNFRAALAWALVEEMPPSEGVGRTPIGLSLCAALGPFWQAFGYLDAEGRGWLERAVKHGSGSDSSELAQCLRHLSLFVSNAQELDRAREYASASVTMSRRFNDSNSLAESLVALGMLESERGDTLAARAAYQEALTIATSSGGQAQRHLALQGLAFLEQHEQHYDVAHEMLTKLLAISHELGDPYSVVLDQHNLAYSLRLTGRVEEAHQLIHSIIPTALTFNVPAHLMNLAQEYAAILIELGHHKTATQLLSAADVVHELSQTPRTPPSQAEYQDCIAKTQAALTPQEWNNAYASGKNTALTDALAQAHAAHVPA